MWGGMGALGVAAGPTVGALLIDHLGWRAAFYVNVPVCSIALIGGWFMLTETPRQVSAHRPDLLGALMITVSLPHWRWPSPKVTVGLGFCHYDCHILARPGPHPGVHPTLPASP